MRDDSPVKVIQDDSVSSIVTVTQAWFEGSEWIIVTTVSNIKRAQG